MKYFAALTILCSICAVWMVHAHDIENAKLKKNVDFAISIPVWPLPSLFDMGVDTLLVNAADFQIDFPQGSDVLTQCVQRYKTMYLFPFNASSSSFTLEDGDAPSAIKSLQIQVKSLKDDEVFAGVDESYSLLIPNDGTPAKLSAATVFGAMYGLETFSQLVQWSGNSYSVSNLPLNITDSPRFVWRGVMIDSARHYLSVKAIKRTIDAMFFNKFNVLHWHIVDAQSFPYKPDSLPDFAKGAYAPNAVYTSATITDIIQYARYRGIRVLPEFDLPGHCASMRAGYPNLVANCPAYSQNINNLAFNPALPSNYEILSTLFQEICQVFTDGYIHVGGDEVVKQCWENDPLIYYWMHQNNFTTSDVESYFENKLMDILDSQCGKTPVFWEEQFLSGRSLPKNAIFEVWSDATILNDLVQAGVRGILAEPWYLDKQIPNPPTTHYQYIYTFYDFYNVEPFDNVNATLVDKQRLILGGEAAVWGESVDSANIDDRLWPRGSAIAERLWSPSTVTDNTDATNRVIKFRCTSLLRRGIPAGPFYPDYCESPIEY